MIIAVKLFMSAATLCYLVGFLQRTRNNALHRKLMATGFALTLFIAVVLVIGVQIFGAGYSPAGWLVDAAGGMDGALSVLIAHRVLATVTLLALIAQVISGIRRLPLHHRMYKAAIPLWLITYVSGMVIFID